MPPPFQKPRQSPVLNQLRNEKELTGQITRIVFTSDDGHFTVARFTPENEQDLITVAGHMPGVAAGEMLKVHGEWKIHRQHGATFEVDSYLPVMPTDPVTLQEYLGSGLVKGIGKAYAKRIVQHFGEDTITILDDAPERVQEVKGVGRSRAEKITKAWKEHRRMHELMIVLTGQGLSQAISRRLLKHYGDRAASVLKSNPYRASLDVHGIGFQTADRIAANLGIPKDSPDRIRAAFYHLLSKGADDGHTWLPEEDLAAQAVDLLALPAEDVERVMAEELESARELRKETLPDGRAAVFLRGMYRSESGVARLVLRLQGDAKPLLDAGVKERLAAFEEKYRFQLALRQREAVHGIAEGGVCVVTGGPGTGKTTLVRALLACLEDEALQIALCSPTGRAAQRLAETTRRQATTIHRLLKWNPEAGGFTHDPSNPVDVDLLIVDEASMLDIPLAYHLLGALKPGTAVVFVGDVDQLPSVGAGNLLRDLIESGRVRTVRLDVIFRQARASAIIVNSHRVNKGKPPRQAPGEQQDFFLIERDDPEGVRDAMLEMVARRIPAKFELDPISDIQVLTPMRRGALGTNDLNLLLQQELNGGGNPLQVGPQKYSVGDKVIQTRNNYDLDVYNGDVGIVQSISPQSQTLRVLFNKRPVEYLWDETDQLSLAYAVTIHKSQGSEYPAVVVLLHTQHFTMLRRNLLYTAMTRGKRLVILIGSRRAIHMAVRNGSEGERLSALQQWLSRPPATEDLFG